MSAQATTIVDKPTKRLFPDMALTKAGLADYYARISPVMLEHLGGRPLTLHRFPDGIDGVAFMQKEISEHFPDWIAEATVDRKEGGTITHVLAEDADTLQYLVDQGAIVLHVWPARYDRPNAPDRLIFDLDPSGADFRPVVAAARRVGDALSRDGLAPFVMTTGSSGLHVVAPLDRSADFRQVRNYTKRLAARLADQWPNELTTEQRKRKRGRRIYLDVARNAYAQTAVAPYSVRAIPGAPVATPLAWYELRNTDLHPQRYGVTNIFRRLAQRDCPWHGLDHYQRPLPDPAG